MRTLVTRNTPFDKFLAGDNSALTASQRRGAKLFFTAATNGGAGCFSCHSGPMLNKQPNDPDVTGTGQFFLFLRAGLIANVTLAVMNLIPIPGLDGSRIVARFLSPRAREVYSGLDQYCALFILVVVFIFSGPVVAFLQAIGNGICSLAAGSPCF